MPASPGALLAGDLSGELDASLWVAEAPAAYRPRQPQTSALYKLLETLFEQVKLCWEERFEPRYGPWRGFFDSAVARYLDCGILERGLARVYCDSCRHEFAVAFSCKGRGLCPSCAAKRGAKLAAFLEQQVLEPVDHVQWVFTIPKMLRPYFLHHRELLAEFCRAAYETVAELMSDALSKDRRVRPGFVAVVQTFNSDLRFNAHVHAIASRGAWDEQHNWFPLPVLDARSAELRFRTKVLAFLRERDLIDEDRVALLLSWTENTGFSVDNSVLVETNDAAGLARLARYFMRSPLSLERLTWDESAQKIVYVPKRSHGHDDSDPTTAERFDPLEFVARLLLHVAQPKLHLVRYFGAYASVVRARRRVAASTNLPAPASPPQATAPSDDPTLAQDPPAVTERRRGWADLIRRVYEVDPLRCPRCGAEMRIIAFILDPAVLRRILANRDVEARNPRAP